MEFKYFSFQAWEIIVCVVHKLLQVLKKGQNKIYSSYVRKYPKTEMILANFESGSLGQEKLEKVIEKVMEFEKLKRVRTLSRDLKGSSMNKRTT